MGDLVMKQSMITPGPFSVVLSVVILTLVFVYCEDKPPPPCGKADATMDQDRLRGIIDVNDVACARQRWNASVDRIRKEGMAGGGGLPGPSARPAGDLCGMRYPKLYLGHPKSVYRQFAVVSFSNDPVFKLTELQRLELVFADNPLLAFRAAMGRVTVALRSADLEQAADALEASQLWVSKVPTECRADYLFLSGILAERRGQVATALRYYIDAVSADEYFWNARSHLLILLYSDLSSRLKSAAGCLDTTRLFLTQLLKLQSMGQTRTQYIDFAERLINEGGSDLPAADLVLTYIYAWNDALKEAKQYQQRVIDAPPVLPSKCQDLIKQQAVRLLNSDEKR